jgi:hypothetical protein
MHILWKRILRENRDTIRYVLADVVYNQQTKVFRWPRKVQMQCLLHIIVTYEVVLYRDSLDAYNLKISRIGAKPSRNPAECVAELNSLQIMDYCYQRFYIDRNL